MSDPKRSPQPDLNSVVGNAFGEHSLFAINRNTFQGTDASTVFRSHFGDSLFEKDTFYIIAGTDSGLLYQYIKTTGIPNGSRYLLIELPDILERLTSQDRPTADIVITTPENWREQAIDKMDMLDHLIQGRVVIIRSLGVVHGHYSPYPPFWKAIKDEFDLIHKKYLVGLNNRPFALRQLENLTENQIPAACLTNTFSGKTAVVLAGGPSLDSLLPWVQKHRHDLLVIAVSRISNALLKADIQPDICVSVDPYHVNLSVSREMFEFEDETLLVSEYHLSSIMLSSWGGGKAFMGKRYPWSTPLEPDNLPSSPGNTVTNTALALALEMGVTQIILGGADFCFSQTGHTHASGSAEHALGSQPMYGDRRVETNEGRLANTDKTFTNCADVINLQAKNALIQGCRIINPSPDSMRLSHIEHLPTNDIQIEPMSKSARETINTNLPDDNSSSRRQHYNEVLNEVERVHTELKNIKNLANQALEYNQKLFNKDEKGNDFKASKNLDKIEKQLNKTYDSTVKFIKYFGLKRFIPLLKHHNQNKDSLKENNRLFFQAIIDTCTELTATLDDTHRRIISRIEEEKSQPSVKRLIKQWHHDKQPGRAIHWTKQHTKYVNQLPAPERQALHAFQATFNNTVDEIAKRHQNNISALARLDGLNSRAREYFQHKDSDGLQSLLTTLNEYNDTQQAQLYSPLVQAYLAELGNDTTKAIKTYRKIIDGPAQIDALTRLFELYTNDHNLDAALDILKTLSAISPVYIPMYADMLQANDEISSAVEIYTDYLLNHPDDLNTMMKLGKIYQQHGSTEGVEWAMNYILGKDPDNHTAKAMLKSLEQPETSNK